MPTRPPAWTRSSRAGDEELCPGHLASSSAGARRLGSPPTCWSRSSRPSPPAPGAEVTVECNPEDVGAERLGRLPGRRGDPDLARRAVDGPPRARRPRPPSRRDPGARGRRPPSAAAGFATLEHGPDHRARRRDRRRLGARPSPPCSGWPPPRPPQRLLPDRRAGHPAGRRPRPPSRTTTSRRPATSVTDRSSPRPATGGRRSPTGPGPATAAGTTASTGSRATIGASAAPPTRTGTATGGGTSGPPTATSTPSRAGRPATAGEEVLSDDQRRFEALALALRTPAGVPERRPRPTTPVSTAWSIGATGGPCSPCGAGCWPTR